MTSHTIRDMTATEVSAMQRPMFDSLFQLYLYDFSEHTALGGQWGELDENGRFDYSPGIDSYFEERDRVPLLIRADGKIAGFVLLHRWSALDRPLDRAVAVVALPARAALGVQQAVLLVVAQRAGAHSRRRGDLTDAHLRESGLTLTSTSTPTVAG